MCTPFQFPYLSLQQLKEHCPSKADNRRWIDELAYRDQCIDVIVGTCSAFRERDGPNGIKINTQERAVILLHRYFHSTSSTKCTGLDKWAHAVACLFVCQKMDSVYHRLETLTNMAFKVLRQMQGRPLEPEYFNADRTEGNPAFLAPLAEKVRQAEMDVLFAVNFAVDISVPTHMTAHHLRKLGLTEEAEMAYPDLAEKINAVRKEAVLTATTCCGKGTVVVLMHPAQHLSMGAIFKACRANRLQWYLKPPSEASEPGEVQVPDLKLEQLKAIAADLPSIPCSGSSLRTDPQQNDGHGCFRSRGGRWVSKRARKSALIKYEGGIRLNSNATDSSNGEATTSMRLSEPSPSPDSARGPSSMCACPGSSSKSQRHVTFGELPPSVALLHAQFRERAAVEERHRRERSPEPSSSLNSDQEEELSPQGEDGERVMLRQPQKRARDQAGIAAKEDAEEDADSAFSRPAQLQLEQEHDCAASKRVKVC